MLVEKPAQHYFKLFGSFAGLPVSAYNSRGAARSEHSTKPHTLPADMMHMSKSSGLPLLLLLCKKRLGVKKLGVETVNEATIHVILERLHITNKTATVAREHC